MGGQGEPADGVQRGGVTSQGGVAGEVIVERGHGCVGRGRHHLLLPRPRVHHDAGIKLQQRACATTATEPVSAPVYTIALQVTGDPATGPYAVEALTSTSTSVAVRFLVDGVLYRQENSARWCLFGDGGAGTPCNTGILGAGETHTVTARMVDTVSGAVLAEVMTSVVEIAPTSPPPPPPPCTPRGNSGKCK
jgi:hypothetical protein